MTSAANSTIPKRGTRFYKHWWNSESSNLKQKSIETHAVWVDNGRPKDGPIYNAKREAKNLYKSHLRQQHENNVSEISNDLHDALLNKANGTFWKTWNNKFGAKPKLSKVVNGLSDDNAIADAFADHFAANCTSQTNCVGDSVEDRMRYYMGDRIANLGVDVETVDSIIFKLDNAKSAGFDNLSAQHLKFCHPIVIASITKLFNIMIRLGYVPDAFGVGITIPLPKNKERRNHDKLDEYRGITISPILSKVFESCILLRLQPYMATSDRQFGFKKGVGCRDAIYIV
jgi:hypothetical protein